MAATEEALTHWVPTDTFGARLTLIRRHLKLSQQEIAAACGIDDGSWSNWERGSRPRGMNDVVNTIADKLGVDREWLMWGGPLSKMYCVTDALLRAAADVPGQMCLLDENGLVPVPPVLTLSY